MTPRGVADFLAELERRLGGSAAHRAQVIAEIAAHLDDLVSEARALGFDQATAEARAVERFGSARRLARGLGRRPRAPWAARIAISLGALGLCGGFAYVQLRAAAPVVGVYVSTDPRYAGSPNSNPVTVLGQSHLVALDPLSLRVLRRGAVVLTGRIVYESLPPEEALVSPDGSQVAIVADASLNFYDLSNLRLLGTARLGKHPDTGPKRPGQVAGETDVIRVGAWLGDNVVALLQHMGPPYARKVTNRAIVVVDASRRRIRSRSVPLKGTVVASVQSADHEAILACNDGLASVLAVEADGSSALIPLRLACPQVPRVGLALSGSKLAFVQAGRSLVQVDLETHAIRRTALQGARAWKGMPGRPDLGAVWWHHKLIVTGASYVPIVRGQAAPRWPGAGVTSIDPQTGRATIITRQGNWVLPTPDRLIVGGPNLGLTAFAQDGTQVWHAAKHQTIYPYAIGDTVFAPHQVKRHTIVDAYAIDTGHHRATVFQRGVGTRPFSGALQPTG